jgi:hypothetical protein
LNVIVEDFFRHILLSNWSADDPLRASEKEICHRRHFALRG